MASGNIVRQLLEDIEPTGDVGRPAGGNARNTRIRDSDTASRAVATLKKRAPDLAAQVIAGDITPHADDRG